MQRGCVPGLPKLTVLSQLQRFGSATPTGRRTLGLVSWAGAPRLSLLHESLIWLVSREALTEGLLCPARALGFVQERSGLSTRASHLTEGEDDANDKRTSVYRVPLKCLVRADGDPEDGEVTPTRGYLEGFLSGGGGDPPEGLSFQQASPGSGFNAYSHLSAPAAHGLLCRNEPYTEKPGNSVNHAAFQQGSNRIQFRFQSFTAAAE